MFVGFNVTRTYMNVIYVCLAGAATRLQYPSSSREMVIWSPSQAGGFPPGTPVSSHTKTTRTSVPTGMIDISCLTSFVIVVKLIKFKLMYIDAYIIY